MTDQSISKIMKNSLTAAIFNPRNVRTIARGIQKDFAFSIISIYIRIMTHTTAVFDWHSVQCSEKIYIITLFC